MLILAILYYVMQTLNAPTWCWWCWGLTALIKAAEFAVRVYKDCKET